MEIKIETLCNTSDTLYYMNDACLTSTTVKNVQITIEKGAYEKEQVQILYYLGTNKYINEKDINKKYFTDKAKLLSYIASQI